MNSTSAEVGVEFLGEISARRLKDLVSPPQLADILLQLGNTLLVIARDTGRCPLSISAFSTQLRRVAGLRPSLWPTLASVPRELPDAARSSKTIATARSRSSAGCCFRDAMSPNFPRGHSLQETRGGPGGWKRSNLTMVTAVKRPTGETRGKLAADLTSGNATAPAADPTPEL